MDNKQVIMIRHDSIHRTYHRAGLCVYRESTPYEVTAEQLEILKNDPRIIMHEIKTVKKAD